MGDTALHTIAVRDVRRLLSTTGSSMSFLDWVVVLGAVLALNYVLAVVRYHLARRSRREGQLPPKYPELVPFLGNAIFFWHGISADSYFELRAAQLLPGKAHLDAHLPSRVGNVHLPGSRDHRENDEASKSRQPHVSIIIVTLRFLFGMPETGLKAYRADDSGPLPKPFPGSNPNLAPEERIDYLLHQSFNQAFSGPGLGPTTQRFRSSLQSKVKAMAIINNTNWSPVDDFFEVFGKMTITALSQAIYGPLLFQLHQDIVDDLWNYDYVLPWLARGIPRILMPGPYHIRDKIRSKLRDWYVHAQQDFRESHVDDDGDGDPIWGSRLVRYLHQVLHVERRTHDDNAMSSHDFTLLWASNFNAVSAATLAAYHIFRDPSLLARLRAEIAAHFDPPSAFESADPKLILKLPLMSAVYAETLRLYVKVFFMAGSPHDDVSLGKWRLPRGATGVVSSGISHMDGRYWNDAGGKHPLSEFWPDRFLVDPADPSSGPVRSDQIRPTRSRSNDGSEKPYFSMEGLDGVWIPYGGGPSICPGRFLAKNAVFIFCALLITRFDIEPRER